MRTLITVGLTTMLLLNIISPVPAQNAIARINVNDVNVKRAAALNEKAERNFRREFKEAYDAKWIEKEDGYRAKFVENQVKYMVDYNKKGDWVSTIANYNEDQLDTHIAGAVKTAFLGYAIVHVTEVRKGKSIVYLVKIDNQKFLKTVRIVNGEMDVYESYIKS
jgi:hypothetical protein